ncbi:hypothetical protein H2248_012382 [Termitomyces sp. 'cryptogamus']|nr:hypothetical protein H2248_012382 [Termitomyces sp. 'cryptogamus']
MSKEGVKAVVVGVRENTTQQYCGTIGGQSTDISTTENKDSPPLPCPPDFASVRRNPRLSLLLVNNGVQGILGD